MMVMKIMILMFLLDQTAIVTIGNSKNNSPKRNALQDILNIVLMQVLDPYARNASISEDH